MTRISLTWAGYLMKGHDRWFTIHSRTELANCNSMYAQVVEMTLSRFKVTDQTSFQRQRITRASVYYTT